MGAAKRSPWWWADHGLTAYCGEAVDGLQFSRHGFMCRPGFWLVGITGWACEVAHAVVDDFGNLVQVRVAA